MALRTTTLPLFAVTAWSRVSCDKPTAPQQAQKFRTSYKIQTFITVSQKHTTPTPIVNTLISDHILYRKKKEIVTVTVKMFMYRRPKDVICNYPKIIIRTLQEEFC
jgi:hypothetical protein